MKIPYDISINGWCTTPCPNNVESDINVKTGLLVGSYGCQCCEFYVGQQNIDDIRHVICKYEVNNEA